MASDTIGEFELDLLERLADRPQAAAETDATTSTVIYVGDHVNCDESNLDFAIASAPDGAELRLQNQAFEDHFQIHGQSISIIGGFEDCTGAEPDFSSTLRGEGFTTTLKITHPDSETTVRNVRLENLNITNGIETGGDLQGGGVHIEGGLLDVVLTDVVIQDNETGARGGGLMATGDTGPMVTIRSDSVIQNNRAFEGGGLACVGPPDTPGVNQPLLVIDTGLVWLNEALRGGGIYSKNCTVISYTGGTLQGIANNTASSNNDADTGLGGGIFAETESIIGVFGAPGAFGDGDPDSPALLADNVADERGGGVWLGSDSSLEAVDARIVGNSANRGGGIYIDGGATFTMSRAAETDCSSFLAGDTLARCSSLSGNFATLAGGAVTLFDTTAAISQTHIRDNSARKSVFNLISDDLTVEGSVLTGNAAEHLVRQTAGSTLRLAWSTIADNPAGSDTPLLEALASDTSPPRSELLSSVFWNPGRDVYLAAPTSNGTAAEILADCLVANEIASVPSATGSLVQDPAFKNRAEGNYHIQHFSPAVDLCDDGNTPPTRDTDQQPRGVNVLSGAPDYDAGADESQGVIFSDGFES